MQPDDLRQEDASWEDDPAVEKILKEQEEAEERLKRNCGRTGPVTTSGRFISSYNALKHGSCSKTLILPDESMEDWTKLYNRWMKAYGEPNEDDLLHDFVHKTARAEWDRIRAQRHYDYILSPRRGEPISLWPDDERKLIDLQQRYLTTAERRFQRENQQLMTYVKNQRLAQKLAAAEEEKARKAAQKAEAEQKKEAKKEEKQEMKQKANEEQNEDQDVEIMPDDLIIENAETGEQVLLDGTHIPGPPDWVPQKIVPGQYGPDHPSNFPAFWLKNGRK